MRLGDDCFSCQQLLADVVWQNVIEQLQSARILVIVVGCGGFPYAHQPCFMACLGALQLSLPYPSPAT